MIDEFLRRLDALKIVVYIFLIPISLYSQDFQINELLPGNTLGIVDEDNDYTAWVEIFNNSGSSKNLRDYGLSNDKSDPFKWKFPGMPVKTDEYLLLFLSGKENRLIPFKWKTLIDKGDDWKYFIGNKEPAAGWNNPGFDDLLWATGNSGFGYGDNDDATYIGNANSVFIRKTFNVNNLENIIQIILNVDYDDAFVAYINGIEVARDNIGTAGVIPNFNEVADNSDHEAKLYRGIKPETFSLKNFSAYLKEGENLISLQVHNAGTTSSDLTVIPILNIAYKNNPDLNLSLSEYIPNMPSGIHADFQLSNEKDVLYLSDPSGETVDEISYSEIALNKSVGKYINDPKMTMVYTDPTPGAANTTPGSTYLLFSESKLPLIIIDTEGARIKDEEKINVRMGIIDNGAGKVNYVKDSFNDYDGKIGIEFRGSTSQSFPKKQYAIEIRSSGGEDSTASLLGLPKEEDWILHAPYSDKTLIRNVLEYTVSRKLNRYASRTKFCELVLNGEYQGVYVLMEKIKRDKNRVNVSKLEEEDIEGDDVTGGYIIKLDKLTGSSNDGWWSSFPTISSHDNILFIQYHYPKPENIIEVQKEYIQNYIYQFESSLLKSSFNDPEIGYRKYIDVDSFIDHMILIELSKSVDGYRLSTFLFKNKESKGGLLNIGPVWDFNISYGNADYDDAQYPEGWQYNWHGGKEYGSIPFWWSKMLQDDFYKNRLKTRWASLRESTLSDESVEFIIDSLRTEIGESAITRNFLRWPILDEYVWPNAIWDITYEQEIEYLKYWVKNRLEWMDDNMPGTVVSNDKSNLSAEVSTFSLKQNYPNPFNPSTVIEFSIPVRKSVVQLNIYDVLGRKVKTIINGHLGSGNHKVRFDAGNMTNGIYYYQLQTDELTETKKMILLK
ncbi:MAG: CotH kinase family protein [Melioribacteraceae bacterium]|nr:CotH kinase family protein [Melioribacteraceae bacterium]